jgi:hypothetical protein
VADPLPARAAPRQSRGSALLDQRRLLLGHPLEAAISFAAKQTNAPSGEVTSRHM